MVNFTYDSRNRLTQAGETTYLYDAENNRIAVIENGVRTEVVNNPHAYLSQLLITQDAQGNQTFYVYGNGLIGQEEVGETYKTYHFDSRGSTTAITDVTGTVTDRFEYGPYGELVNRTGTTLTPFLYNGRDGVITDHNGLYYMRARYYNPDIKRFINQDVIQGSILDGRSLNRYAYVNGNPVSLTDPFGLSPDFSPLSIVHGMLDLVSMIDPTGVVDGINAGIYFLEGDKVSAAITAGCMLIPAFFDAGVKVAKWGSKGFKSLKIAEKIVAGSTKVYDVGKYTVKRVAKGYDYARETWKASGVGSMVGRLGDDVVAGAGNAIGNTDRTLFMKMDLQLFAEKGADDIVAGVSKVSKGGAGNAKTYQTYTKTNPTTGKIYSGRTSGTGTPLENIRTRDANHHINENGFGPAVLDASSSNKAAIRGREQMLIEANGGAKSTGGISGNAINGIGPKNPKRSYYLEEALKEFMK